MPAAITITGLSYRTPDHRLLFDHLDLSFGPRRTGLVGRNGTGKSTLVGLLLGELVPPSGTITIEGSVAALRQSVQVEPVETVAALAGIAAQLACLDRLEAGRGSPADAEDADWTLPQRFEAALAELELPPLDPRRPVSSLSGGQRTRLALAGLVLRRPDILLLDEPTNNLDGDGRSAVSGLLAGWRGMAVVVSHDRTLLREMDGIVELTSLGATSYGGNYDHYRQRKDLELEAASRALDGAERHLADVDRRIQAQRERKARQDAGGRRQAAGGGQPRIVAGGLKRHAEETSGAQARLAGRLREAAASEAAEARARIEILQPMTAHLAPSGLPAGRRVLEAHRLSGGPAGLPWLIRDFDFVMVGPARVAITGPNGAGKSSLLRLLTGALPPTAGTAELHCRWVMLDQSLSLLDPMASVRDNYRRLNPGDDENRCRAALARFKFRADAALQPVGSLSGGEMLRAGLAATIGAGTPPELLILDEPTNHLDLDAIEAVEAGLLAYDGALLVVSHDRDFLAAIGIGEEIVLGASGA